MVVAGILILTSLVYQVVSDPQAAAQGFFEMLHR